MAQQYVTRVANLVAKRNIRELIKTLQNDDQNMRNEAISALGDLGDPQAVKPLAALLGDEPYLVATTLAGFGAAAVEPLIAALSHPDPEVRWSSAEALGKMGDQRAFAPLVAALQDPAEVVVFTAIKALGQLGDPRAVEPLLALFPSVEKNMLSAFCEAFRDLKDTRTVAPLVNLLQNEDRSVRDAAARALEHLAWHPDADGVGLAYWLAQQNWLKCSEFGAAAVPPLTQAFVQAPEAIAQALEKIGPPAVDALLEAAARPDKYVAHAALKALANLGDPRAIEPLANLLKSHDPVIRRLAMAALQKFGAAALPTLAGTLREPTLRSEMISLLRQTGPAALPVVLPLLQDADPETRRAAIYVLGYYRDPRALEPLTPGLRDEATRHDAAWAIENIGCPPEQKVLVGIYRENEKILWQSQLKEWCNTYSLDPSQLAEIKPALITIGQLLYWRGGVAEMQKVIDLLGARPGREALAKLWEGIGEWTVGHNLRR